MTDMSGVHAGIDERVAAQLKALKVASAEAERMGAAAQAFLDGANEVVGKGLIRLGVCLFGWIVLGGSWKSVWMA